MAKKVRPPRIVREIDWVDNFWHFEGASKKGKGKESAAVEPATAASVAADEDQWAQEKVKPGTRWPKVQLYCLMGIRGSWTVSDT